MCDAVDVRLAAAEHKCLARPVSPTPLENLHADDVQSRPVLGSALQLAAAADDPSQQLAYVPAMLRLNIRSAALKQHEH